jgi:2'-5' RNA ligase
MKKYNLYFLAIVLPEEIQERVVVLEKYISEKYNSHKSLRIVPHITLKAPFTTREENHERIKTWFSGLFLQGHSFEIELKDFGAFPNINSPVIYINPVTNKTLSDLQSEIIDQFVVAFPDIAIMDHERHFCPHVTIAYRDLSPQQFVPAWEDFRNRRFSAAFPVRDFHLLQHDGNRWNTIDIVHLREAGL